MHPEIDALVQRHRLPPDVAREVEALVEQLTEGSIPITLARPDAASSHTWVDAAVVPAAAPSASPGFPARYDDLGWLGVGGMGEVRRVRDRELGRTCAYKVIRPELLAKPSAVSRFIEEAQVAAQLQHPNIAPVYDAGRLPDGRAWFTMKEVRGQTLTELIHEAHTSALNDATLRRLGDVFSKVCDGVGYAHARGVVHRDLKPDNVMVGSHGEVLVLDWGLAKLVGRAEPALDDEEPEVGSTRAADDSQKTRVGGVMGTPAYMAPEQARGEVDRLDARADVYALGAILYEILAGRRPYRGLSAQVVLRQVLAGPPDPPRSPASGALPEELVSLCARCMARDPADRPADGAEVAREARSWLDGAKKRQKALEVVAEADALTSEVAALRARAAALSAEGDALLAGVEPWQPEEAKAPGWAAQDAGEQTEREASRLELKREALLAAALTHAPELVEAHEAILQRELATHRVAEAARAERDAARAEARLEEHAAALPAEHPMRLEVAAYLKGDGALTLRTDTDGAEVTLHRVELRNRRWVEVPDRVLGRTPLVEVPLARGSYLCVLRQPGRADVRYPVSVGRGEHWHGVRPGGREPFPIRMPLAGELGPDDCLVPAGWFWSGGDPLAVDPLPRRRLWCDELVMRRFPVTNREYLVFLDDLSSRGRDADAERFQPRERAASGEGSPVFERDGDGRFVLQPDADGDLWDADWPVVLVDWFAATAYAAWLAEATGQPWRLPGDLEFEKAARGVDGRFYPWGDHVDPSWCSMRASHPGRPLPFVVDSFPVDTSVYGVRGLAGNMEDWCADPFRLEGPPLLAGSIVAAPGRDTELDATARVVRGGHFGGSARFARAAGRNRAEPDLRMACLSLRVAFRPGSEDDARHGIVGHVEGG